MRTSNFTRRTLLGAGVALAAAAALLGSGAALAQQKLKVAAIYTVPVEQQWVSRIHKALNAAKAQRRDRICVLRERHQRRLRARHAPVCRAGQHADRRRSLRGRSGRAQSRQRLSEGQLPARLVGQAAGAELLGVRQLHPGACVSHRHDRRRHDQVQRDRHGGRLSDSRRSTA